MRDKDGWSASRTALMSAAQSGHTECVKLLIEKESGMQDKDGRTALMLAAINGHIECVKLLLEKEKGTKTTYEWCGCLLGSTSLILAAQNGRDEAVKLLMAHEDGASGWTNLIYAAYLGDVDAIMDNFHQINCKDITGMTALMWAAHRGHTECVKPLLEKEAGMQAENGWTALMFAAYNGNVGCARLLAEREKDMKLTCRWRGYPSGTTALAIAMKWCHTDIVSILSG
ncbi:Protein 21.1 [Giardia duodenalis ATCC 50581]|nr:Protein 21.1 [Giardia intestinalis ATCC 50581]